MADDSGHSEAAQTGARVGGQVGTTVGAALGTAADEVTTVATEVAEAVAAGYETVRERVAATEVAEAVASGYGTVRERIGVSDAGALVRQVGEVLEGVVEDGRERASAVLRTSPPPRRWPWALAAALGGALGGAAVAFAVRRVVGQDAADAQEPEHLRAVVDPGPPVEPAP